MALQWHITVAFVVFQPLDYGLLARNLFCEITGAAAKALPVS